MKIGIKAMHLIRGITSVACISLLLQGCQMSGANLPKQAQKGQYSDSHTYYLENGLQVILWPNKNSHSKNEASLDLIIHSGSLQETDEQLGYAHFLEHMVFEQTDASGSNPIDDGLKTLNLELSTHANAYTTFDHTRYYLDIPNVSNKRINTGLSLLARFAYQAPLKSSDMEDEIGVVSEEWRRSQPEKQNYEHQRSQLDQTGSRHKARPPIGTLSSIKAVSVEALGDYYQAHYRPGNATLVVTGDVDTQETLAAIKAHFSPWLKQHGKRAQTYPKPRMRSGTFDVFEDVNNSGYFIGLGNVFAYEDYGTPEGEYSLHITDMVMSMLDERMQKLATQQKTSLHGLFAGFYRGQGHYGDVGLGLYSQPEDFERGVKLLASVVNDLLTNGFSQAELDNNREQFLISESAQQDSASHLSNIATDHVVDGEWLRDQAHYFALLKNKLSKLTLAALNTHARSLFKTPHKIEIISQPGEPVPEEAKIRAWVESGKQQPLAFLHTRSGDEEVNWSIEQPAGQVVKQQKNLNGVHQLLLSNGVKVNYRYSGSAPGKVYMRLLASGGLNALSHQEVIDTRIGLPVIAASGLQGLDGHALRNWLEAQGMTLQPEFNLDSRGFYLDGPVNKVDVLMQTLHVALQDARVDPDLYDYFIPQFEQSILDLEDLEYVDYLKDFEQALSQGHPAYRSLTIAEINSVTSQRMQDIYAHYIAGAQDYTLHIVGDISLDDLLPGLQSSIASLPLNGVLLAPNPSPTIPLDVAIEGHGNESKAASINYYLQVKRDSSFVAADKIGHLGLLSKHLTDKLSAVIREDLGLTYSVQANIYQSYANDPVVTLGVHLQSDPQNVEQVIGHIEKALASINDNGVSQVDIDQDIVVQRQDFNNAKHKAKFILQQLVDAQLYKHDASTVLDAGKVHPNTQAKALDGLLNEFINHNNGHMTAILHP